MESCARTADATRRRVRSGTAGGARTQNAVGTDNGNSVGDYATLALLNVICTSGLRSKRFGFVAQTRTTSLLKTPFCEAVAHLVLED